jgi:hypothetical protein
MTAVGDIYELAMTSTEVSSGLEMVNVFHFRQKAGFLSAINLIGEWQVIAEDLWQLIICSGVAITKYSCRSLIPHNTDWYETTTHQVGGLGTFPTPLVCAAVITWRTGLPGRRHRGRTYIGGIERSNQGAGRWANPVLTAMNNLATEIMAVWSTDGQSTTTEFGVWSRLNAGPTPPFNPAGFRVVDGYTVQTPVCTMGSRKAGRGI